MPEDYYKILGLEKTATEAEIKRAYRKLAHEHHPDKGGGDDKKFKEVSEAYQVLSDPEKRKQYDQFGHTFDYQSTAGSQGQGQGFGGFNYSDFGGQGVEFDFSNLGDIFDVFFGGERRTREARGADLERRIEISFEEAYRGTSLPVELEKNILCLRCKGEKNEPGTEKINCPECKGAGKKETVKNTILGQFKSIKTCENCEGSGKIPKLKCSECLGAGVKKEKVKIDVIIPAGVKDGMTVRVPGAGEAMAGGAGGDLYLEVSIKPHPNLTRQGDNILFNLDLTFSQAALGDQIEVPIVSGQQKIKIPAGIQSGEEIRLRGKGFPHLNSFGNGDEIIKIKIITPKTLSHEEKEIFERLKKFEN